MLFNTLPFSISVNNFKQISDGIWVYKKFVPEQECNVIAELASKVPEHMWFERDWYKSTKKQINELLPIHKKMNSILKKDFNIGENLSVVKFVKGQTWNLHKDNHDSLHILESNSNIKEGETVYPAEYTTHGVIFYFNEYEGAEISYPEIGIRYKPEKGDMLVHRSDIAHEVLALESDIRYTHSNKIFVYLDVPLGVK
jgi:hypothetical protein